jgi:hypothetical protein
MLSAELEQSRNVMEDPLPSNTSYPQGLPLACSVEPMQHRRTVATINAEQQKLGKLGLL